MHGLCTEPSAHLQTPVEGLAAENLGVRGALEFRQTVKTLWSRSFGQPTEIAIGPSHVAVRARRNIFTMIFRCGTVLIVASNSLKWHSRSVKICTISGEPERVICGFSNNYASLVLLEGRRSGRCLRRAHGQFSSRFPPTASKTERVSFCARALGERLNPPDNELSRHRQCNPFGAIRR